VLLRLKNFADKVIVKTALEKAIDELKNGMSRNGIEEFYIELKVDKTNEV
jgi:hypothetical protein